MDVEKRKCLSIIEEMYISTASTENSTEVPQKPENVSTI